jgi:histone deacetylase complex regulatory component SIN3
LQVIVVLIIKYAKCRHTNIFYSNRINTPQVLERVTLLFKGKPWLIKNFLMFLPPGHILDLSPKEESNNIYVTSPTGKKIIINTDQGVVRFEQ